MRISDWSSDVCSSDLELIEVGLLQRRNLDRHDIAAEVFGDQLVLQQFLLHAIRIGAGLIDFVDGDDDRHLSGLGVIDRLDRLLLDAVVGGPQDRKSVVYGKSVSVSVDRGCRRINKKKKQK